VADVGVEVGHGRGRRRGRGRGDGVGGFRGAGRCFWDLFRWRWGLRQTDLFLSSMEAFTFNARRWREYPEMFDTETYTLLNLLLVEESHREGHG